MNQTNRVHPGELVTVGRIAVPELPTYLVAALRYGERPADEARWTWWPGWGTPVRVWMTLAAAEQWAKEIAGRKDGGPTAVLRADRVPPYQGQEPESYQMPHCRVVQLYELDEHGRVVPSQELPGFDEFGKLVHELYHPMPDSRGEEVSSVDPPPA